MSNKPQPKRFYKEWTSWEWAEIIKASAESKVYPVFWKTVSGAIGCVWRKGEHCPKGYRIRVKQLHDDLKSGLKINNLLTGMIE